MAPFGVIFDADGVLFDSERQSLDALRLAIEEATAGKVTLSPDLFDFVCGRDDDSIVTHLNKNHSLSIDLGRFRQIKIECYRRVIAAAPIAVASGAIVLLDRLAAASIPYAIATAAARAKIDLTLATLGLADRFPIITSRDDVAAGKPDPALFLLSAKRLGLAPQRIVVFEDSINGVVAANRAGMFAIGVVGTFSREQLSRAQRVIETLDQVAPALLRKWLDGQSDNSSGTGGN
jgi:HAD superfamily hydrolase (TIGR01509 family)